VSKIEKKRQLEVNAGKSLPIVSCPGREIRCLTYNFLCFGIFYKNMLAHTESERIQISLNALQRHSFWCHAESHVAVDVLQAKADDLRKAAYIVVTNCHNVVVASCSLAPQDGTDNLTLTISLPDELEAVPLALHSGMLVERLNAAYARGTNVLAWAINGPGCRLVATHRAEFASCQKANEELSVFAQYLAVDKDEVASPSSFKDAMMAQLRILAEEIIKFRDPLSKQSSDSSSNKEISNDRIERYLSKVPLNALPWFVLICPWEAE
jgi:hypothetical protein